MPLPDESVSRFLNRKYKVLEHRSQRSRLGVDNSGNGWGGGNTACNSIHSTAAHEVRRGQVVTRKQWHHLRASSPSPVEAPLPPVRKARPPQPSRGEGLVWGSNRRVQVARFADASCPSAGKPTRIVTSPVLPLSKRYTSPDKATRNTITTAPPGAPASRLHRSCSLTRHLDTSLGGGHGPIFDSSWGSRFAEPIVREKGWKHGFFGSTGAF